MNITSAEICRDSSVSFTSFGYAQDRLWGRTLEFHPHIHYVVPGGALSTTDALWHPSRIDFYLPVKALSQIFKAKFLDEMKQAGLLDQIPPEVWQIDWNVNSQAVGSSEATLKYLAPYVFRAAISNSRILNGQGSKPPAKKS